MPDFAAARRNMVDTQLRTYDVTSHRLLDATEFVARELFVTTTQRDLAYTDQVLSVTAGDGVMRQLLPPMILARMLQALDIQPGEAFLDCGGGTGYGAALAAKLGARGTAVEDTAAMADLARQSLQAAGITGVDTAVGPLASGPDGGVRFDAILVHGAAEAEPHGLLARLSEGGRLAIVMGPGRSGRVVLFTRTGDSFGRRSIFDASAPRLQAFAKAPAFAF